jgi:hypothetical protein
MVNYHGYSWRRPVNITSNDLAQEVPASAPASDEEYCRYPGHGKLVCSLEAGKHVRGFMEGNGGNVVLRRFEQEGVGCEVDGDGVLGGVVGERWAGRY